MKTTFLTSVLIFILGLHVLKLHGQTIAKDFTYTSDRMYSDAKHLYGCTFIPFKGQLSTLRYQTPLKLGSVTFTTSSNYVDIVENVEFTLNGVKDIEKTFRFSISSIKTDQKSNLVMHTFVLRDVRVPDALSSMTIVLNSFQEVQELHFAPLGETPRIYFFNTLPKEKEKIYNDYFTHQADIALESIDLIWGKSVFPFSHMEHLEDYELFERIYPGDAISFKFEERTVQKGKKEKLMQYVIISRREGNETKTREWLVKKLKPVVEKQEGPKLQGAESTVEIKLTHYLLSLKDEEKDEQLEVFLRCKREKLHSIEVGEEIYNLRPGKRH